MPISNPTTIHKSGSPNLYGDVTLSAGTNVTLTQTGNTIQIAASGGAGASWTEVEIDFGATTPKYDALFTITDASVNTSSKIIVLPSGKTATGRVSGDAQWDNLLLAASPGTGNFTLYALAFPGPVKGKRVIQYTVA